jgi:hypothetical protein
LWYWQINMRATSASLGERLRAEHIEVLSPQFTQLRDGPLGWGSGILTHDPDGHSSLITVADRENPK